MITPAYGLTATERVLPRLALDWTTGVAQLGVDVARTGVATFVGSNGLIQSATANTQRIDYSTGTAGLLVEESRTNITIYSEDFSNVAWSSANFTLTPDDETAPDGTTTADKIIEDTGSVQPRAAQTVTLVANATYTFSMYVKVASGTRNFALEIRDGTTTNGIRATFDLETISLVTAVSLGNGVYASSSIKDAGNGWRRLTLTGIGSSTVTSMRAAFRFTIGTTTVYTGNGTSGFYIWGAQLEAGAFPTSYIPTVASQVTRTADVATMTGTNFSDWYNQTEGAFQCTFSSLNTETTARFALSVSDGTLSNNIFIAKSTDKRLTCEVYVLAAIQCSLRSAVNNLMTEQKATVLAYKLDSFAASTAGLLNDTDNTGTIPTVDRLTIGDRPTGNRLINGHIQKIMYWPQRLINAETTAFSK
jgi:hypothetical protein